MRLSHAIQDYLKTIYALGVEGRPVSTTAIARRLGIAPASVTGMLQRMASMSPPLIHYRKRRGVTLTEEGERIALETLRHHRLLETYLVVNLGYSWDAVHEEACRLEHVISEDFERRIAEALGNPERDPHGDPIPTPDLTMPQSDSCPLASLQPPQRAVVRRVCNEEPPFLRHIARLGLKPGVRLEVLERSAFDHNLRLRLEGHEDELILGPAVTERIYVEVIS
ncbi:MAG: metal-dependent transcriptional regulator [Anaerolineae bacterium]|nr:MAG: metal-dependent transcriptional regulator [Anaerolineae bacterium]